MIVLMPSRVFSSVGVITRGSQRKRDTTRNAKRRKGWTAEGHGQAWGCCTSCLFGTSPLSITVLLLSTPNSSDWLLEEVRDRTWGNIWHIQLWLSQQGVAEQLEKGGPVTWLMSGSGTERQRPIFWQLMLSSWDLWTNTCQAPPGTGVWPANTALALGEVGFWALNQHQQRAASPMLGALQPLLMVVLPSTAVTECPNGVLHFTGITPRVTAGFFFNWIKALKWHGCLKITLNQNYVVFSKWNFCSLL